MTGSSTQGVELWKDWAFPFVVGDYIEAQYTWLTASGVARFLNRANTGFGPSFVFTCEWVAA